MRLLTVRVTFRVPEGLNCNHDMKKSTPATRCRFCTEVNKGNFVCVLHNEPLLVAGGIMIQKTKKCLQAVKEIQDA